jgi:DNA-binding CsgD family transcriptional regulator
MMQRVNARLAAPLRLRLRPSLAALLAASGILVVVAGLYLHPPPTIALTDASGTIRVATVAVGSNYWVAGVRPGMEVVIGGDTTPWAPKDTDRVNRVNLSWLRAPSYDEHEWPIRVNTGWQLVTITLQQRPQTLMPILLPILLVLAGSVASGLRVLGGATLLAAGVGLAIVPLGPVLGLPNYIPFMAAVTLASAAATRMRSGSEQRRLDILALAVIGVLIVAGLALGSGAVNLDIWPVAWSAPLFAAVGLALLGEFEVAHSRYHDHRMSMAMKTPVLIAVEMSRIETARFTGADDVAAVVLPTDQRLREIAHSSDPQDTKRVTSKSESPNPTPELRPPTLREGAILDLIAAGESNAEIAGRLGISARTVEAHLSRLFQRYGVVNRAELAVLAHRHGWLTPKRD